MSLNDADLEMIAYVEAGAAIAGGVCPICEMALDPMATKWDDETIYAWRDGELVRLRLGDYPTERAAYAAELGPCTNNNGIHDNCMEDPT